MICAVCKTIITDEDEFDSCDACQKVFCSPCSDVLRTIGCNHIICRSCTSWHEETDSEHEWEGCPLCGAEIMVSPYPKG